MSEDRLVEVQVIDPKTGAVLATYTPMLISNDGGNPLQWAYTARTLAEQLKISDPA